MIVVFFVTRLLKILCWNCFFKFDFAKNFIKKILKNMKKKIFEITFVRLIDEFDI